MKVIKSSHLAKISNRLSDVRIGQCFRHPDMKSGSYYIKTSQSETPKSDAYPDQELCTCVSLNTGLTAEFWSHTEIIPVEAEVVITSEGTTG